MTQVVGRDARRWFFVEWTALLLLSVAVFASFAIPSKLPIVDLPLHARILSLFVGKPIPGQLASSGYELFLSSPYWFFYWVASPFTLFFDCYQSSKLAIGLCVAAIPLSVGFWLHQAKCSPIGAVFTAMVLYCAVVGWGLAGIISGLFLVALVGGFAERLSRKKRVSDSVVLSLLLFLIYYSHVFIWVFAIALATWILILRPVKRTLLLAPLFSALVTVGLGILFRLSYEPTPYMEALQGQHTSIFDFSLSRITEIPSFNSAYGDHDIRINLILVMWSLFAISVLLGLRGLGSYWRHRKARLYRARYAIVATGVLGAYALFSSSFLINIRFPWLLGIVLPFLIPSVKSKIAKANLLISWILAMWIAISAISVGMKFQAQTQCVDSLLINETSLGKTLTLVFKHSPVGIKLPVYDHLGNYAVSISGGAPMFELAHSGVHAIRSRSTETLPSSSIMLLHAIPQRYRPTIGRQFDTILTVPPIPLANLLGEYADEYELKTCGEFGLARRRPPSSPSSAIDQKP